MKTDEADDLAWVKSMMQQELDLRPPSLALDSLFGENCIIVRNESDTKPTVTQGM